MLSKKKSDRMVPVDRTDRVGLAGRDPPDIWSDMDNLFDAFRSSFDDLLWAPATRIA